MSELASFSESSRQSTLQRFQLLRAHFEDGRSLAAIAREAKISYRTLQYWLERYRTSGLAALARKPRIDRGKCRKSTASLSRFLRASAVIFLGGGRPLAIVPVDPITTEFRRVYVIPDYRRQGIAAKLIRWLEERARAGGFRGLSTFPLRGTQRDDLLSRPGLRGGVSRSHVKFICAETLAYRDSHAARARVGEGRVGGSATGRLGWRLF
jgi:GNAT superfamily N-acetyltransferase